MFDLAHQLVQLPQLSRNNKEGQLSNKAGNFNQLLKLHGVNFQGYKAEKQWRETTKMYKFNNISLCIIFVIHTDSVYSLAG